MIIHMNLKHYGYGMQTSFVIDETVNQRYEEIKQEELFEMLTQPNGGLNNATVFHENESSKSFTSRLIKKEFTDADELLAYVACILEKQWA